MAAIGPRPMADVRVGQQSTLTRIWAPRGTRPRAPRDTRYTRACIFGAVCPERGATAAPVMPHADTAAMNAHLAEISRTVAEGAHAVLVLDGAGWHGAKAPNVPDNITLLPLPPYAPELNPIDNLWAHLRANRLAMVASRKWWEFRNGGLRAGEASPRQAARSRVAGSSG